MNSSKSDFTCGSILGKLLPFMLPILGRISIAGGLRVQLTFWSLEGLEQHRAFSRINGSQVLNLVTLLLRSL